MNPQYGKIATTPEEMAANRATLVAGSSGKLQDVGGNVIPASALSGKETPFVISPPKTSGTAVGFGSELTSLSNAGVQEQDKTDALLAQQKADTLKTQGDTSTAKKSLLDYLGLRKGQTELTDTVYSTTNDLGTTVDETGKKLRNVNNQINAIDIGTNEQIKRITAQTGLSETQKNTEINNINRIASSSKADLYIDKLMAQGDYDSAKTIADRKVSMLMEQDKMEYDKLLFDYNENKDLFTKSEQRQFELMASNRKAEMDKKVADATSFEKTKIDLQKSMAEQKAPPAIQAAVAQIASDYNAGKLTASEAQSKMISTAGVYGGDIQASLLKKMQIDKLVAETEKITAEKNAENVTFDTSTEAGQLSSVAQNLASKFSSKFAQTQFLANVKRLATSGDTTQLADYIFSESISNIPDPETRKKAFGNYRVVKQLSMLEQQLADYEANDGDTNILIGKKENILAKLGTVQNVKLREIGTAITNTMDELARARTGAVISKSEEEMYRQILPGIDKTGTLNKAIISGLNSSLSNDIDSILKFQLTGSGFDTISKYLKPETQSVSNSQTVQSNGQTYTVGQVYNDGTSNWTVDANGKWTKQ